LPFDFRRGLFYRISILMRRQRVDAAEFETLLEKFSSSIKASVLKLGLQKRGIDPEDIIQEVKIKIWMKFGHEKNVSLYSLYIQRTINSILVDQIRKMRRQERLILHEKEKLISEERENWGTAYPQNTFREVLGDAAESLMETRRMVVKLFLMDLTIDEISSTLRWSRDKTRNLLYRGLADLREILKERGVEYEN
jgi:RNA polymerase sigma factor (sigma-70 family)